MSPGSQNSAEKITKEIAKGIGLPKCRKCGCMVRTLEAMQACLTASKSPKDKELLDLTENIDHWLNQMEAIEYDCLGCKHCHPAEVMKVFKVALFLC